MQDSIGSRLRSLIDGQGVTIRAFSERCEIPYRTLQEYLVDKSKPGTDHLKRLAVAGVNINWLLTGSMETKMQELPILNLKYMSGIAFEWRDLGKHLLWNAEALMLQDFYDQVKNNPDLGPKSFAEPIYEPIFSLFSLWAKVAEEDRREQIQRLRKDGWTAKEVAELISKGWGWEEALDVHRRVLARLDNEGQSNET